MGWKGLCLAIAVLAVAVCLTLVYNDSPKPEFKESGWWGRGRETDLEDTKINRFEVQVEKEALLDLQRRLEATRLGEDLENNNFDYGFQVGYMRKVLEYWKTKYDWKKHEAILNSFPQYKTQIEGIDVHFLRVKPVNPGLKTRPLLLVHGWPSSVWEFYKIIPILTDPAKYGFNAEYAFEVICPSIPGYGFSEAPHQKGFNEVAAARIFFKLMQRLGHDRFYYQGGDWGSLIGAQIATMYPKNILGLHTTNAFVPPGKSILSVIKQLLLAGFPSIMLEEGEKKTWPGLGTTMGVALRESGYMHIQSTRPDTVAYGLNDSPVGLAAYILEKFSVWTNQDNRLLADGGLTKSFTLDELLTNVMIYWVTGSIGSSVRLYREVFMSEDIWAWGSAPITVPTGVAAFPGEFFYMPKSTVTDRYVNIIHFNCDLPKGGHFAAFEEPELLAKDLLTFVRKVEDN